MNHASDLHAFETDDGPLVYRDTGSDSGSGSDRPLVLLHGAFADHTMWDDQVAALARRHRVIAPDARGHGGSANASRPFRQADDLAALLRHLDTGPAVLVGLSMGAITAVDTALEHPDLVRALVLSGGGTPACEFHDRWAQRVQAAQSAALAVGDLAGWFDAFLLWGVGPHRRPEDVDPELLRRLREMAGRTLAKHSADEPDHHTPVPDTPARAKGIAVPVLAVNGALDSPDLAGLAERVALAVARGSVTTIEGAAHYPNIEQPEAFNRAVESFLDTVYAAKD